MRSPNRVLLNSSLKLLPYVTVFILILGGVTELISGAWTMPKNQYFFKVSGNYFLATEEFNYLGEKSNIREELGIYNDVSYRDFSLLLYLEYGFTDWFTLVLDLPYKNVTSQRTVSFYTETKEKITNSGFSDLRALGRLALLRRSLVFSLQPGIKVPMGYEIIDDIDAPNLGTGEVDGEISLLSGYSFWPNPLFITGGFGYRWRGGPVHDEYIYNAQIGYFLQNFGIKLALDGVRNTQTPPDIYGQTVVTPLPGGGGALPPAALGDDEDFLKIIPEISYKIYKKWFLQLGMIHVTSGKNIESGTTYSIGLAKVQ